MKRVFIIVLDSFGIGELPDAADYGDIGSNTLATIAKSNKFLVPNLFDLGLFNIDGVDCKVANQSPKAAYARMTELSKGKDTTIGHWEISGIVSLKSLPTYPHGFPPDIIAEFEKATGRKTLCNKPISGTQVIAEYGKEHVETGALIVYTSADSVFQIAAHEDIVPLDLLYQYCEMARVILNGEHGVGRIIARPFVGTFPNFKRTSNRHDFSILPPRPTMLNFLKDSGYDVHAIGKISDIFANSGITDSVRTKNNEDGMTQIINKLDFDFHGLCFLNLVDFDMLYGHRNDIDGYAVALSAFDSKLQEFMAKMKSDDVLMITADHGCDPGTASTDHSREYIPLLIYGDIILPKNLGTRESFADIGATILDIFNVRGDIAGESMLPLIKKGLMDMDTNELVKLAFEAKKMSYSPYSHFAVGAALLGKSGNIYLGCNIENAAYSPTNCAERTAFFKAVSEGEHDFLEIAICGGFTDGKAYDDYCSPCGVCRQVMKEFCNDNFRITISKNMNEYKIFTLKDLLPLGFGPHNMKTDM